MNTEFFRARLEEVRSNLELTRVDKRKTLENLLERNLTQELKEVLRSNLSLLLQAEEKYLELERQYEICLLYTSPSPRDRQKSRMPSSA